MCGNACAVVCVVCVENSLCHTQNRGWGGIGDSLHIKLARYSFLVGNHERCLAFFQKLFSDCHQPPPAQNSLLREFLHLAAQIAQMSAASSELVASCLPVPVIDQQSVRLFLASYDPSRYRHKATRHATRHDTAHV